MKTDCTQNSLLFPSLNRRKTVAHFDGGAITSDVGGLLLQPVERITGIVRQFAACITDYRDPERHIRKQPTGPGGRYAPRNRIVSLQCD